MSHSTEQQSKRAKTIRIGKQWIEHWQVISVLLMVYNFAVVCTVYFLALWLRFYSCNFVLMLRSPGSGEL